MPNTSLRNILQRHGTIQCAHVTLSLADEALAAEIAHVACLHRQDLSRTIRWITADSTASELTSRLNRHVRRFRRGRSLTSIIYAVSDDNGETIGMLNLQPRTNDFEFGFWLIPEARGNNLTRSMIHAMTLLLTHHKPSARFIIRTDLKNIAVTRIAIAAGFTLTPNNSANIVTFVRAPGTRSARAAEPGA